MAMSNGTKGHEQATLSLTRHCLTSRNLHSLGRFDGETRTRTGDTTIFSRVLYQLSYLAAVAQDIAARAPVH
jgi:hypothetical protein